MLNSRMKDFYDVYALIRTSEINIKTLGKAIQSTFSRRKTKLPATIPVALTDEFAQDGDKQTQWRSFIEKNDLTNAPGDLSVAIEEIRGLVLPVFAEILGNSSE